MSARDYHRFMDAPAEAGFTTDEVAAAYRISRSGVMKWGLAPISKLGRFNIYRKSDVLKMSGPPPVQPIRKRKPRASGNGELPSADSLRVLYPIDVRRVQEAFRKELECALAPMLIILDRHGEALAQLVVIESRLLELWKPAKAA